MHELEAALSVIQDNVEFLRAIQDEAKNKNVELHNAAKYLEEKLEDKCCGKLDIIVKNIASYSLDELVGKYLGWGKLAMDLFDGVAGVSDMLKSYYNRCTYACINSVLNKKFLERLKGNCYKKGDYYYISDMNIYGDFVSLKDERIKAEEYELEVLKCELFQDDVDIAIVEKNIKRIKGIKVELCDMNG